MKRRHFIASGAAALLVGSAAASLAQTVPFSQGTQPPKLKLPPLACDCHMHIYDSRFPAAASATIKPPDASVADYRKLQARLGSERNIVVTPSTYGTDNRVTLDAIRTLGASARGIAVVGPDVTPAELKALDEGLIRGIRFNLAVGAFLTPEMIAPLARKVADLGWHVQVNMAPDLLLSLADTLTNLPTPVVFDHLARIPQPAGISHPAYAVVRRLLDKGHGWIKLSGPYLSSVDGSPDFRDAGTVAAAFVKAAPERMLWGSDWPHPTKTEKPTTRHCSILLPNGRPMLKRSARSLHQIPRSYSACESALKGAAHDVFLIECRHYQSDLVLPLHLAEGEGRSQAKSGPSHGQAE